MSFSIRHKIIAGVVLVGLILIALFNFGLSGKPIPLIQNSTPPAEDLSKPRIVSTNPPELLEKKPLVFRPDQVIDITFNAELENAPETKITFNPPAEVEVKLSGDSKSVQIHPKKPYKLGQGYTIFINGATKLKGGKTLEKDYDLHFNVINYSGI